MDSEQHGPYDVDALPQDGHQRLDLGSLLIAAPGGQQVKLAVHQESRQVSGVQVVDATGGMEIRAFAAPRSGARWEVVRAELAAQAAQDGVVFGERKGRWGIELIHPAPGGPQTDALPPTRIVGIDGPRWLLRVTFLGRPAVEPDASADWDDLVGLIGVRRGDAPLPVGSPLPLRLPQEADLGQEPQ